MLDSIKEDVCKANQMLKESNLVIMTWGNVSQYDEKTKYVIIKPSGISYEALKPENMVVVDLNGTIVEGEYRPSSDTLTHLEIYKNFPHIKSIVHTHSTWATIWAQIGEDIPPLGTTHADDFWGNIPCTRDMTEQEIENNYEKNTGKVIVEKMKSLDYKNIYGILVKSHGPFVFEKNPIEAVNKAIVMEEVAKMAWYTCNSSFTREVKVSEHLIKKHFERKHGTSAYYGQK